MMRPRALVFGLVFCGLGVLLFIAGGFEYRQRVRQESEYASKHPYEWRMFSEPSPLEEGSAGASLLSVTIGALLIAGQAVKAIRRRVQ